MIVYIQIFVISKLYGFRIVLDCFQCLLGTQQVTDICVCRFDVRTIGLISGVDCFDSVLVYVIYKYEITIQLECTVFVKQKLIIP